MSEWTDVENAADLDHGEHLLVDVDDVVIAVFNLDGEFFAIEDVCTHDGSEIASGCIKGDNIECPRHGAQFCIKTGEVKSPPAYEPVDTFPIQIIDGVVQVRDHRWD